MVILETGCFKFHCFSVIFLNKMRGNQWFLGKHTQSGSRYFSFLCFFYLFHPVELICPHRSTTNPILFRLIPTQNSHLNPLFCDHFMNSQVTPSLLQLVPKKSGGRVGRWQQLQLERLGQQPGRAAWTKKICLRRPAS